MDTFFDTTVLVAASVQSHPPYTRAKSALRSSAEVFAVLTCLPVQPRIHPVEAARIVTENL